MPKYRFRMVLLLMAVLAVTGCTGIVLGSGEVISEARQVSNFDRVVLRGQGVVNVSQGGTESLSVESNANILEHVEAEVVGGSLEIGLEEGINIISNARLTFNVSVDDLNGLRVAGSGSIQADGIETDNLEVIIGGSGDVQIFDLVASRVDAKISGSGEINLAGDAAAQGITISGSGKYLAGDLCSESVMVKIDGSGDATVCATESLDTTINGSGSVDYYGKPSINSSGSGSGRINNLGEK